MSSDSKTAQAGTARPAGSPEIPQFHLPGGKGKGTYAPRLYGAARIQFGTRRQKIDETRRVMFILPLEAGMRTVDWDAAKPTDVTPDQLLKDPPVRADYLPLPPGAMKLPTFSRWVTSFDRWLARTQRLELPSKTEGAEPMSIGPKRGGVSVELVAIAWELT